MARPTAEKTAAPVTWLAVDLGDTEIELQEHADGAFTLTAPSDGSVVLSAEQMQAVATGVVALARQKGWST